MKKVIIAMVLIAGFTGMAQKGPHRSNHAAMKDLTPEQVATLQTKKLTLALDLSTSQQKAIQELHVENVKLRKEKRASARAGNTDGERGKPSSEELYAMQNERLDRMIFVKAQMKESLSPEQYEKWQKAHHHNKKHKEHRQNRGKR